MTTRTQQEKIDHANEMALRDSVAAQILAGLASSPNEDHGMTIVEVIRAFDLAEMFMKERSDRAAIDLLEQEEESAQR